MLYFDEIEEHYTNITNIIKWTSHIYFNEPTALCGFVEEDILQLVYFMSVGADKCSPLVIFKQTRVMAKSFENDTNVGDEDKA